MDKKLNLQDKLSDIGIAKYEIKRILKNLALHTNYYEVVWTKYEKIWSILDTKSCYKDSKILPPLVIFFSLRLRDVSFDSSYLIEISYTERDLFFWFVIQILEFTNDEKLLATILKTPEEKDIFLKFISFLDFFKQCAFCGNKMDKEKLFVYYSNKNMRKRLYQIMNNPDFQKEYCDNLKCCLNYNNNCVNALLCGDCSSTVKNDHMFAQ